MTSGARCTHLDQIRLLDPPDEVAGCPECLAAGDRWVHLRMRQACGQVGCCDDSPNRRATAHHRVSGHPVVRSIEPGEDWSWCYEDELMFRLAR
jgi:ubiquitin-hydrolase Zn-finger-containing protein